MHSCLYVIPVPHYYCTWRAALAHSNITVKLGIIPLLNCLPHTVLR
jgi:hypothetical protein